MHGLIWFRYAIALTSFFYVLELPLISQPASSELNRQSSVSTASSILLRLRGGSNRRRNRGKTDSQLMRKWQGQGLGMIDGREVEGPIPPPTSKNSKMVSSQIFPIHDDFQLTLSTINIMTGRQRQQRKHIKQGRCRRRWFAGLNFSIFLVGVQYLDNF